MSQAQFVVMLPLNTGFIDVVIGDIASEQLIDDVALTGNLYINRSLSDPVAEPGTIAYPNIQFTFTGSPGEYSASLDPALNLEPGILYVLVLDGNSPSYNYYGHWELPTRANVRNSR